MVERSREQLAEASASSRDNNPTTAKPVDKNHLIDAGMLLPDGDYSVPDQQMAEVADRNFLRRTFHDRPSLRSKHPKGGWVESKPYEGEPFDEADWTLAPGGWDHEHCTLCYERISNGMTYWANGNEVTILCESCHGHYFGPDSRPAH
jgi:hypothetical protein